MSSLPVDEPLQPFPTISVVIISRNEGEELARTVANIRETLPASRRELIVVDDGSEDGSTGFLDGARMWWYIGRSGWVSPKRAILGHLEALAISFYLLTLMCERRKVGTNL